MAAYAMPNQFVQQSNQQVDEPSDLHHIVIDLSDRQVQAINLLGLSYPEVVNTFLSAFRSQFKPRVLNAALKATTEAGTLYDQAVAAGMTPTSDRANFIANRTAQLNDIISSL